MHTFVRLRLSSGYLNICVTPYNRQNVSGLAIAGAETLSVETVRRQLAEGGRFVRYSYCISVVVFTFRLRSNVFYVAPYAHAAKNGLPYSAISFLAGWWGLPFGPIFTVASIFQNIRGNDVTAEVIDTFSAAGVYLESWSRE